MSKNIYTCNICEKQYKSSQALNGHKRAHSNCKQPIYLCCSILTKQVIRASGLLVHEEAYTKKLKYCPVCNKEHTNKKYCSSKCSAIEENNSRKKRGWDNPAKYTIRKNKAPDKIISSRVWFVCCHKCGKLHTARSLHKKYCDTCRITFKKKYKLLCAFSLNNHNHSILFDSKLIRKYGWYSPHSSKTPNPLGVTWDHLYPLHMGYEHGISPNIMKHPANAELVPCKENMRRYHHEKNMITLKELQQRIKHWDSGNHDLPKFYNE